MATKVFMEALSPTMEEGRLVKWHKREGEVVKAGETLAEVETDKAIMDLVARADGVLRQVAVTEGQTVPVGNVVAVIAAPGENVDTSPAVAPVVSGSGGGRREALKDSPTVAGGGIARSAPTPVVAAPAAEAGRLRASPLAKRIAKEAGVDLQLVTGSGPGGRVVKRDLESAAGRAPAPASVPTALAPSPATGRESFRVSRLPSPERAEGAYQDVPLTQIRKTIAKRLATSLGPIPHFFLTTEVDMERAAEARDALNRQLGDRGKVSFNDVVVKATALALTKHRACNAWFQDDHIRYWNEVHIGMAVAVEDGLITPVIRHADLKALLEIGGEARDLAEKARNRRLQPSEYTGATFSVSNLGMFEIDQFTAVINPPEAGIIAVGSIAPKPVVWDGQVVPRRRMRITMSCDHRVIDGATGAAFLKTLKEMLENPLAMLL